ncbi:MAG TPA: SbcC/MukB-like Walker B domain-containing protein [Dongiaceae bacterium]|nr:SbcC/MukB-like Walker B domain-containing protein [Dongiaceae bacterium]
MSSVSDPLFDYSSISRLTAINWSFHERLDEDIRGTTAIVGDNGAGKSALLDMIQVAYAGGRPPGVKLNPGAQKNTKGGRTIGEYSLGAVESRFLRDSAITYICLGFEGDGRRYTIGLAISAARGATTADYDIDDRFIAPGVLLSSNDFLDTSGAPRPWAAQKPILETMCKDKLGPGKKKGLATYPRDAGQYLEDHLGLASDGTFNRSTSDLLRCMSNALAFKDQIDSADTFVRTFILNADPINIDRIRRSASDYDQINSDIEHLEAELSLVKKMQTVANDYIRALENRDLAAVSRARAAALLAMTTLRDQKLNLKRKTDLLSADTREFNDYKLIIAEAEDEVERLQTLRSQSSSAARVVNEKKNRQFLIEKRQSAELALKSYSVIRDAAAGFVSVVEAAHLTGAAELKKVSGLPIDPTSDSDSAGLALMELSDIMEVLGNELERLERQLLDVELQARRDADEKKRAAEVAARTGRAISVAADDLMQELRAKGMTPRLVCSVIEVSDPSWRDAAEARLGRDREAVIVDPQHCREAILYYRENRFRFQRECSVVNTAKERLLDAKADKNTLATVISTTDKYARAFIDSRLGRIRLAKDQAELEQPGAAIMRDCTFDDGLVVRTLELHGYKIGAAGANAVQSMAAAAEQAEKAAGDAKRESDLVRAASRSHANIARIFEAGFDVSKHAEALIDLRAKIKESETLIGRLENEGDKELMQELEKAKDVYNGFLAEQNALANNITNTKRDIADITRIINQPDTTQEGSIEMARHAWDEYRKLRKIMGWYKFRPYFLDLIKNSSNYRHAVDRANRRHADNEKLQGERFSEFQELLNQHKQSSDGAREFNREHSVSGIILPWIENRINAIEKTDLIARRQDLSVAWSQVRQFLQEDFIHRVSDRAKHVKNSIREISRNLSGYEFHRETYSFRVDFDPRYRDIVEFAERANNDEMFLDQIMNGNGQDGDRDVLDQIRNVLLGQGDAAPDPNEIEKLADYRNWYRYSLEMTNVKTGNMTRLEHRIGKGSGGEIQAPFYIVMAVAIASIHHSRSASTRRHAGPVLLDEAFSKLSPANARACIDFFKNVGLQVILAAPGGKRAVIDACCNCVLDLIRSGDEVWIDPEMIGERLHRETLAADPDNYSMEELRLFIEQSKGTSTTPAEDVKNDESMAAE